MWKEALGCCDIYTIHIKVRRSRSVHGTVPLLWFVLELALSGLLSCVTGEGRWSYRGVCTISPQRWASVEGGGARGLVAGSGDSVIIVRSWSRL